MSATTLNLILGIVTAVWGLVGPALIAIAQRYTGIKIEEKHATWLQQAVLTAVTAWLSKTGMAPEAALAAPSSTRETMFQFVSDYVHKSVPDAAAAFDISPTNPAILGQMALSKLALLVAGQVLPLGGPRR